MSKAPKTLTADECHRLLDTLQITDGTPTQVRHGIRNYCIAIAVAYLWLTVLSGWVYYIFSTGQLRRRK